VRQDRLHLKAIEFTSYRGRRSREEATGTPSVTPVGTQIPDEPLITAARGLVDAEGVAKAERELAELRDSDPAFAALDALLAAIVNGHQQPSSEGERLALTQRAYDKSLFATAARLWIEALEVNPALAENRQAQHRYNATCCAALAASGQGRGFPLDKAAKDQLRHQALDWLKAELAAWTSILADTDGPARQFIAQTLKHWKFDPDLTSIRDAAELARLPDLERADWETLWKGVDELLVQASAEPIEDEVTGPTR